MDNSQWNEIEPLSDINVTPFVDVLLVLLIIFMITAPIVNHVIQVDLPKDTYNQDKMKPVQEPLRIVLDREGVVYVGETRIGDSLKESNQEIFQKSIRLWAEKKNPPWIVDVEADEAVSYGAMIPVVARLKELGVSMNLVIQPKSKK